MSNFYSNLVDIDNANSLDNTFWLTEVRGLDLQKLDAEAVADSCDAILAWAVPALEAIVEEGHKARKAVSDAPDWDWETSVELAESHLGYVIHRYRLIKKLIAETNLKLEEALDRMKDQEFEASDESDPNAMDEWNKVHFAGAKLAGERRFTHIMFLRRSGRLSDYHKMERMFRTTQERFHNREIVKRDYLKINAHLASWMGCEKVSAKLFAELKEIENNTVVPRYLSDPAEANAYDMSIEDAIDLKRRAEAMAARHLVTVQEAVLMLLGE